MPLTTGGHPGIPARLPARGGYDVDTMMSTAAFPQAMQMTPTLAQMYSHIPDGRILPLGSPACPFLGLALRRLQVGPALTPAGPRA